MRRHSKGLISGRFLAGVAWLAVLTSAPAFAQQAPTGPQSGVDVIIVTAQQRDENLQDVPVSAATLGEEQLSTLFSGGEDILAIATRVPGVYAESSNGRAAPRFYIRGLGNTDFDLAASQPVSVIMDDVVLENVALKSMPLFDLEQVEVYRGPQGTLFGRNTTAGIIRFKSIKPSDEFEARGQASIGSFGTMTVDAGVGGALIEDLVSVRLSGLYQHRNDWVDNTTTPGANDLGAFDELAGRLQVLVTPSDRLDILLNVHGRDYEGTSALFRANVIDRGSSGLNARYERDRVSFDGGGGNRQAYRGWGTSANIVYDAGPLTVTSITAYETTEGFSRGDIDGSAGPYTFNFTGPFTYPELPFASDTQDTLDDLDQFTQEVRIASPSGERLTWQAGVFAFRSEFTVTTFGPTGFPPPASLRHENDSWAVFGQASYDWTDRFTTTGGLRFTRDDKELTVLANPRQNRSVSDQHLSWELSGMYDLTPTVSVYGRVADGFRGPTIQGRDVAFFADPSVAQSETILSWEAGWKSVLAGGALRLNGAVYTYTVSDIQLTAVGGAGNTVQLVNASKGDAWGLEVDAAFQPTPYLTFTGGLSYTDTELKDSSLAVGICAQCTVTDPTVVRGGATRALVNGNPFPNAPEMIADITARYAVPFGADGELFAFTDWAYQGKTNLFLYESVEFQTDDQFEGGLKLGYARSDGSWEVALFARNITDEDNIKGAIDFNNNTAFVNEPRIIGVSLNVRR
ncbi:TonB-dependent receptor plug domain-containing protein [bacterium]|nr:TonB-dependent receptor plug domain-containing protein [bacterium]